MTRLALSLLMTVALSGCILSVGVPAHLYPVEGPAASQTPPPIYKLSLFMIAVVAGTGRLSATLPDGEVCHGDLETLARNDPSSRSMEPDWDRVYGQGFFVATLLGKDRGRATLTSDKGACLHIELFNPHLHNGSFAIARVITPEHSEYGVEGVARDEHGNLFKLTFGGST
jgi:hypothetical protein